MKIPEKKFYRLLTTIPAGKVTTYKALAQAFHSKAYRHVGRLLRNNPDAPVVPCHRVVASDLTLGGYMGRTKGQALATKKKMLIKEGVLFKGNRVEKTSLMDKLLVDENGQE